MDPSTLSQVIRYLLFLADGLLLRFMASETAIRTHSELLHNPSLLNCECPHSQPLATSVGFPCAAQRWNTHNPVVSRIGFNAQACALRPNTALKRKPLWSEPKGHGSISKDSMRIAFSFALIFAGFGRSKWSRDIEKVSGPVAVQVFSYSNDVPSAVLRKPVVESKSA